MKNKNVKRVAIVSAAIISASALMTGCTVADIIENFKPQQQEIPGVYGPQPAHNDEAEESEEETSEDITQEVKVSEAETTEVTTSQEERTREDLIEDYNPVGMETPCVYGPPESYK